MAQKDNPRSALFKSLRRAQQKHAVVLSKVEKARARLEKRKSKLLALEAKIALLERRAAEPHEGASKRAAANKNRLRRARLIVNPESVADSMDSSKRLVEIVSRLREHGILAGIGLKTSGKAARELAREAVENGDELVIVAGGDGTIEEVAAQLIGTGTTLGVIPIGTMNNLARSLGIPLDIEDACALLGMGVTRSIDVGRVISNENSEAEYFLEAAGIGLSGIVIPAGQALKKGHWDALPLAVQKLFDTQPEPIEIQVDDQVVHAKSQIVTVSNAPLIASNILVAPDAKMDDGHLDVAIYEGMTKTDLLRHFAAATLSSSVQDPNVKFYRARRVQVVSQQALDVNSDKNAIPDRRVLEVEVVRGALSVIVGNGFGLSLPVQAAPAIPPQGGSQSKTPQVDASNNGHGTAQPTAAIP